MSRFISSAGLIGVQRGLLALLIAAGLGCGSDASHTTRPPDSTATVIVPDSSPSIKITSPADGQTLGLVVEVDGNAWAPRGARDVTFVLNQPQSAFGDPTTPGTGTLGIVGGIWGGFPRVAQWGGAVEYQTQGLFPGPYTLRARVRDSLYVPAYDSAKFTVIGPHIVIDSTGPSTLFQRSFVVRGQITGTGRYYRYIFILDPGTPQQHADSTGSGRAPETWRYTFPDTLVPGPHHFLVRLVSTPGMPVIDSAMFDFVAARSSAAYKLTPLDAPGLKSSTALHMNAAGMVLGTVAGFTPQAGTWESGQFRALPTLEWDGYRVTGINSAGDVSGSVIATGCGHPAYWPHNGPSAMFIGDGSCSRDYALAVNDSLGFLVHVFGSYQEIVHGGAVTDSLDCNLTFLNNRWQSVGVEPSGLYDSWLCGVGISYSLPNLSYDRGAQVVITGLNDSGIVIGRAGSTPPVSLPFTRAFASQGVAAGRTPPGVDLGLYVGPSSDWKAEAINNPGTIAMLDSATQEVALIDFYTGRTTSVSVASGGWIIRTFIGMSDAGVIAANAIDPATGATRAVLLSPVSTASKPSSSSVRVRSRPRPRINRLR